MHKKRMENIMRNKKFNKLLSLLLSVVLIVSMALIVSGCGNNAVQNSADESSESVITQSTEKNFEFIVIDAEGNETEFDITTDKKTVGEALADLELIEGEDSEYGLYVKTVNGITADYDTDGTYWAFYINDEYATTGVDSTDVEDGAVYSFKIE